MDVGELCPKGRLIHDFARRPPPHLLVCSWVRLNFQTRVLCESGAIHHPRHVCLHDAQVVRGWRLLQQCLEHRAERVITVPCARIQKVIHVRALSEEPREHRIRLVIAAIALIGTELFAHQLVQHLVALPREQLHRAAHVSGSGDLHHIACHGKENLQIEARSTRSMRVCHGMGASDVLFSSSRQRAANS